MYLQLHPQAYVPMEEINKFRALEGAMGKNFGHSVAVSGNIAIVGAKADNG